MYRKSLRADCWLKQSVSVRTHPIAFRWPLWYGLMILVQLTEDIVRQVKENNKETCDLDFTARVSHLLQMENATNPCLLSIFLWLTCKYSSPLLGAVHPPSCLGENEVLTKWCWPRKVVLISCTIFGVPLWGSTRGQQYFSQLEDVKQSLSLWERLQLFCVVMLIV